MKTVPYFLFFLSLFIATPCLADETQPVVDPRSPPPPAEASAPARPTYHDHLWFSYFELGGAAVLGSTTNGGYVIAPWLAWKPMVGISRRVALRGNLGFSILKNANPQSSYFNVLDYELLVSLKADGGYFELGGGQQNWSQNGGTQWVVSANVEGNFNRKRDILGFLDRYIIGYSAFFLSPHMVHEIRFGLGVAF